MNSIVKTVYCKEVITMFCVFTDREPNQMFLENVDNEETEIFTRPFFISFHLNNL